MNKEIPLSQVNSFSTHNGTLVTERIEKGLTMAFNMNEQDKAIAYARKTNSYPYDLFCKITVNRRPKDVQFGYAVPK